MTIAKNDHKDTFSFKTTRKNTDRISLSWNKRSDIVLFAV